jgi:hypothetical protein
VSLAVLLLALGGCSNSPPRLERLADPQTALVENEFTLPLRASDPEGDAISFTFKVDDLPDINNRAAIDPGAAGQATFRFTPIISDVGSHTFDFIASDGSSTAVQTIVIEVKSPDMNSAPIFRQPLGTGTTLDLGAKPCGGLTILIEDNDSPEVEIKQEEPVIAGADFQQDSGLTAKWSWCPTADQIAADDRYMLRLSASDGKNTTTKDYLIVLRKPVKTDCPGAAPTIELTDTPQEDATLLPLIVFANVADDVGIKVEPLIYYSLTPPANPPDLSQMTQLSMLLLSGDMTSGLWGVELPNPVVDQPQGATATVYYLIVAQDNDDAAGDCDHITQAPASGAYTMTITNPGGGQQGRGLCEACTADIQCGGPSDNCLRMGTAGEGFCFRACGGDTDCVDAAHPTGYYCSLSEMVSVDGVSARQCIPDTYSCGPPPCVNDSYEPNDSQAAVTTATALAAGSYPGLKLCPSTGGTKDEDWYPIQIAADSNLTASINGTATTDLDLALLDANGVIIAKSDGLTSVETVTACLKPGRYYLRVYSWAAGENTYSLTWSKTATTCSVCADDPAEPDDNAGQARVVNLGSGRFYSDTNAICANNEDWYKVTLQANQHVYATVAFTQTTPKEDLDIRFFGQSTGGSLIDITNCDETNPVGCSATNGQSSKSNENFTYQASTAGTYYVVVHGWNASENLYDICIALSNAATTGCPALPKP